MKNVGVIPFYLCMALYAGSMLASGKHESPLRQAPSREASRSNPYDGQRQAAKAGQKLFGRECVACHGAKAQGTSRGPTLISQDVSNAPAGAIFWVLRNGSLRAGMPSFSHLPEPQRWQIITYLKSLQ